MRFECSHCGKKYSSADDPMPGRVYVIGCRCGHSIVVKGPDKPHPAAASRPPAPARDPPGAPPEPVAPPAVAPPQARRPAAIVPPTPSPAPAGPAFFPESGARRGRAGPSLDPFAEMQDLSGPAGGAPLTDVPEIKGPVPEPTPPPSSFDPFAAGQGLLLEEDVARSFPVGAPVPAQVGPDADEVAVTFSEPLPAPLPRPPVARPRTVKRAEGAPRPAPAGRWPVALTIGVSAAAAAAVAAAAWFFFARPASTLAPAPAAVPVPASPPAAPAPAPAAPRAAESIPESAPPHRSEPAQVPAPPPPARPPPGREAPRRLAATRPQKKAAPEPVAAAPVAREVAPPAPAPHPPNEPQRLDPSAKPKTAAPDKAMLDPLGAKQDLPAAPPPAAAGKRGDEGLSQAELESAVTRNREAFNACAEEALRNEPGLRVLGRRVGLYLTVNPSGVVTAPRLDDPELLDTEFGACLKSAARKMVFPQFQGDPFQVRVPLALGRE